MNTHIIFNGKKGLARAIRPWIGALNDPRIVTEKAGFLFKASLHDDLIEVTASPVLINGERLCHYNMHMEQEDAYTLIGDVNATGIFTILFKPEGLPLSETQKAHYVQVFRQFAKLLLEQGYSGEGQLNEVTQSVLTELGLSPVPRSLSELQD